MRIRKHLMGAALSALICGSAAFGQTTVPATAPAATGPTKLTPIDFALSNTGFGAWENAGFSITGFVDGGYFYDFTNPHMGNQRGHTAAPIPGNGDSPTDIAFAGLYSNRGQLDQLDLMLEKTIPDSTKWDWGFQIEQGYGTDDAQIHSNGLLDNRGNTVSGANGNRTLSTNGPDNQYDIVQANVSLNIPIGNGLTIQAGKFVTLIGYEYINPTLNAFYTHSYSFTFGIPLTQTGVLASYTVPKLVNGNDWTFKAGITRGWNQSVNDNNGEPDFLGEMTGSLDANGKIGMTFNVSEGPEAAGDNHDYWTVLEAIPTFQISDQLKAAVDIVYGDFPHGSAVNVGRSDEWYAVTPYLAYTACEYLTLNLRGEWYRDQGGFTLASLNGDSSTNFYEAAINAQIKPMPDSDYFQWLQFRPELRFDFASHKSYDASAVSSSGTLGKRSELTFAVDAIMQF